MPEMYQVSINLLTSIEYNTHLIFDSVPGYSWTMIIKKIGAKHGFRNLNIANSIYRTKYFVIGNDDILCYRDCRDCNFL